MALLTLAMCRVPLVALVVEAGATRAQAELGHLIKVLMVEMVQALGLVVVVVLAEPVTLHLEVTAVTVVPECLLQSQDQ